MNTHTTTFKHQLPIQLRFNNIDKFGHVNNAVFFQFYDTAKTDYFASICTDVDWNRTAIIAAKIDAVFLHQIHADNHIKVRTKIIRIGHKSFELEQEIIDVDSLEVKSRCTSVMVLFNLLTQQSYEFPSVWREKFETFENIQ